jgi:NAD(P)-dependent dehydrogenase (short-subunit alcohol dehydrogenase family)
MAASLSGKHALVTGAGRGIGAAIVQALASEGANITLLGRSLDSLQRTAKTLKGVKTFCVSADVTRTDSISAAVAHARVALGPVSILVNNAGRASSAAFHKTDDELWQTMLAVNLTGTFNGMRECLPDMVKLGYGRIVNVASTAGLVGYRYVAAYCAAKHGVIGLTRSVALEVATRGVTVNAVCPGYTETDLLTETVSNIVSATGLTLEAARAELLKDNPQKRFVAPTEVANAVLWLCAPGSDAITGQSIPVAGGEI